MSSNGPNGNDDDDIDKLTRELRETNSQLDELVDNLNILTDAITRQSREEVGAEDSDTGTVDLWQQGKISPGKAGTADEYTLLRRETANDPDISVPQIERGVDLVDIFFNSYRMFGEHLNRIEKALSKQDWRQFVQDLAVLYGVDRELIDILNPGPSVFGITTVDDELKILEAKTHMNFLEAYGSIWFEGTDVLGPVTFSGPQDSLLLPQDQSARVIMGRNDAGDINAKMAETIDERRGMSLPEEYRGLL